MDARKLAGYETAAAIYRAHLSPRTAELLDLARWVRGTQYDHLPPWDSDTAPRLERAPCIVYPAVAIAIASHVDMVLGQSRWPAITSRPGEDDSDLDAAEGLPEQDSALLDAYTAAAMREARFPRVCREALAAALGCGSAAVLLGVRAGRLAAETVAAAWCEPTLADDGSVTRLVIQYPYLDQYRDHGRWAVRTRLYRREIDAETDTTFQPADASDDADRAITWVARTRLAHGLGFCPAIWYPIDRGCSVEGRVDGTAIHATLLDEVRAHDIALSSWHSAALYAGDPQWTEIGVEPGTNPSAPGRQARIPASPKGGDISGANRPTGSYIEGGPQTKTARRKSASSVWQYESPDVKVALHALPGDALKALEDNARDLRMKLVEALAYVPLDPESVRFASSLSGKALETLRERQTNRDDTIRDDVWDGLLRPGAEMLLRISAVAGARGQLRTMGAKRVQPVLSRFNTPNLPDDAEA